MLRKAIETKSLTETREVWELFVDMTRETLSARVGERCQHPQKWCNHRSSRLREKRRSRLCTVELSQRPPTLNLFSPREALRYIYRNVRAFHILKAHNTLTPSTPYPPAALI